MKILSVAHRLEIGGSQVNAIDLAATMRDQYGHEVVYFAESGPMLELIRERNISFTPVSREGSRARQLKRLIEKERPHLIHVWDRWQLEAAYWGAFIPYRLPMLVTCMEMQVPSELCKWTITTFGTPHLVKEARRAGYSRPALLLPPVDIVSNAVGVVDGTEFTAQFVPRPDAIKVVTVSRLVSHLKHESLACTIEAVRTLGRSYPITFVIVGEGEDSPVLYTRARAVNAELGREAIVFAGPLLDPRPAYAAADIVIGMGSSSLRGMAFAKPVIVVGEGGFARTFTEQTADWFYENGLYGMGDTPQSAENLIRELKMLLTQKERWQQLGSLSRRFVEGHFSLSAVARDFDALCNCAVQYAYPFLPCACDAVRKVTGRLKRSVITRSARLVRQVLQ